MAAGGGAVTVKAGPPSATNEEEALLQAKAYRKVRVDVCVFLFLYTGGRWFDVD